MPSSLKQKLFYGLHRSKKSEINISAPQQTRPEKVLDGSGDRKSKEAARCAPDQIGQWQDVQKEADTTGHPDWSEASCISSLNDVRLRTSTIERNDPATAQNRHQRQQSGHTDQDGDGRASDQLQRDSIDSRRSRGVLIGPVRDPFAENYANKNISRDEAILAGDLHDSKAIRAALEKDRHNVESGHRRSESSEVKKSRRPVAAAEPDNGSAAVDATVVAAAIPVRSSSLRRGPSPEWPLNGDGNDTEQMNAARRSNLTRRKTAEGDTPQDRQTSSRSYSQADIIDEYMCRDTLTPVSLDGVEYIVQDSSPPVSLDGVVDLTNAEDTRGYTSYAPAVTHETVIFDTHEILHEQTTREIHTYDAFHRVLPIIQVEVLPPRHYIPNPSIPGDLIEISPQQILGGEHAHWQMQRVMQEALDKNLSLQTAGSSFVGRRPFTARNFPGSEGKFTACGEEDGFAYTEQTWVHPPQLHDGGEETGQSQAFHFGTSGGHIGAFDFGLDDRPRDQ